MEEEVFSLVDYEVEEDEEEEEEEPQKQEEEVIKVETECEPQERRTKKPRIEEQEAEEWEEEAEAHPQEHSTEEANGSTHTGGEKTDELGLPLPASPCDERLQKRIADLHKFVARKRATGRGGGSTINSKIRHAKDFKNPYLLNWLVQHCNIDESASNYPKHLFDPHWIRTEQKAFLKELTANKPAAAAVAERTTVEFQSAGTTHFGMGSSAPPAASASATAAAPPVRPKVVHVVHNKQLPFSSSALLSSSNNNTKRKSKWDT
ncbi:SAP30-binding protein [Balamuthia mandrillaris]